jgi:ferredoxin
MDSPSSPPPGELPEGSIVVELARSGVTVVVPPGETILDTIRDAGIPTNSSCEQGTCGACETRVIEGIPDHFDAVLSPKERAEGKVMMICCSGALTDKLVLDL